MDRYKILDNKVLIQNKYIKFDGYMNEIIENIELMLTRDYKANLILTLDKERMESFILIIAAINIYFWNIGNSKTILDQLEVGDIVCYKDKKVEYLGIDVVSGQEKIKLRYADTIKNKIKCSNNIIWINISDAYKLSLYFGDSTTLNTMSNNISKKIESGNILIDRMLEIGSDNSQRLTEEQIIIVFESKKYMEQLISNIKIEIDNVKYDFTQVFPCKYYSDVDNGTNLKGNKRKERELLIFTSRLDIAKELLINNKSCKTLILLGEDTYKNYFGGVLDNIINRLSRKKLENLILYNSFDNINNVSQILDYDIDVYSWNKSILIDRIKKRSKIYMNDQNEINNYLKTEISNVVIDDLTTNSMILQIRKDFIKLINSKERIIDKENFIRLGFKIYKLLQNIIFPIKKYEEFDNEKFCFYKYFNSLNEILDKNNLYIINMNFLKPIVDRIEELYKRLYFDNPKLKYLKQNSNHKSSIVCNNSIEEEFLNKEVGLGKREVITIDKVDSNIKNKNLIFASFYDKSKKYQIPYCQNNNTYNILYTTNAIEYNSKAKYFNQSMSRILEKNLVLNNNRNNFNKTDYIDEIQLNKNYLIIKDSYDIDVVDNLIKENEKVEDDENLIEEYIRNNTKEDYNPEHEYNINSLFNISNDNIKNLNSIINQGFSLVKKKIIFTNKSYCYLTKNYVALCIDREGKAIEKSIDVLKIGEKIIFIDEKSDSDLELLFEKIINSEIFKETYKNHYENMIYWKEILKGYMNRYNMDYMSITNELRIFKINKTAVAVRQWLTSDGIIGPREEEFYRVVGKITGDKKMLENWIDIYESNNIIRGFRTQFKKAFKNIVKDSVIKKIKESNQIESLVKSVFGNLNEYANIVEIETIEDISEDMSYIKANSLIEIEK
ncbi:DrmE family protein [Clostridium saccharoperbutylacetonicum]